MSGARRMTHPTQAIDFQGVGVEGDGDGDGGLAGGGAGVDDVGEGVGASARGAPSRAGSGAGGVAGGLGFGEGVASATAGHEARDAADQPPRQSTRGNREVPPTRFIEMYLASVAPAAEEEVKQSPSSAREALQGPHSSKWQEAMDAEMEGLGVNGVYELVNRPAGKKVAKSKWVLRVKANERGEVEIYVVR